VTSLFTLGRSQPRPYIRESWWGARTPRRHNGLQVWQGLQGFLSCLSRSRPAWCIGEGYRRRQAG
jgi:hypothetical protein